MTTKRLKLKGQRFGKLLVIEEDPIRTKAGKVKWLCICDCGSTSSMVGSNLKNNGISSCRACAVESNKTHGLHEHTLYSTYWDMKTRCYKENNKYYKNYGGRGITVCYYWLEDFMNFYNDMIGSWKKGLHLDRKDNDKGYNPDNCRWITGIQNNMNKGSRVGSSSKYKGVQWSKRDKRWVAKFKKDGKQKHLGNHVLETDAAKAYNDYAFKMNGEYAYLNKIED